MKPLKYYIKERYDEKWLAKVFFREKFKRSHGKQYFRDFSQTDLVRRQGVEGLHTCTFAGMCFWKSHLSTSEVC